MSLLGALGAALCAGVAWGCASTEFFNEGPGQPTDRASGSVPDGQLGVCKRDFVNRPPIVNPALWDDARLCTPRTPGRYVRLGMLNAGALTPADAQKQQEDHFLSVLREGEKEDTGNNKLVSLLRNLHDFGLKDPLLRDRVVRETSRTSPCDYTYLFNTMAREHNRAEHADSCAAYAYDQKTRSEVCLFDTKRPEVVWLTSSWACVTHTGALGEADSCYRLCGYDDYCAKQVSCVAPDVDLLLCAMGVCLPGPRAAI